MRAFLKGILPFRLRVWMMMRPCSGCGETGPHDHHLTAFGRWWYGA